jgi:hypothetical protein
VTVNGVPVWLPADNGVSEMGTAASPRLELDPFLFGWPAGQWGGLAARKVGHDVIVSAKTAAVWLGAKLAISRGGYAVRISREGYSAVIDLKPGGLAAWGVRNGEYVFVGPRAKTIFGSACYYVGDSTPEMHGYTALYLRRVVTALGGTSHWNPTLNRLIVAFPASVPTPVATVAPVQPAAQPSSFTAPPVQLPSGTSPHNVGM